MSETNNNNQQGSNQQQDSNRTFSQEEVNGIVKTRIAEERKKYADYEALKDKASKYDAQEEANKTELQKANEKAEKLQKQLEDLTKEKTLGEIKSKISAETGVPAELLSGTDEESCKAQAEALLKWAKPAGKSYPGTKKNTSTNGSSNLDGDFRELANQLFG